MRFGGIVLTALLILGACTSDPQPKEPEPTATTATPTASPPSMPAQAKKDTPEGAAAFVKHYIDLVNFAANSGDASAMQAASRNCKPCDSYSVEFAKPQEDGDRFSGTFWKLTGTSVSRTRSPVEVRADVSAREGSDTNDYVFTFVLTSQAPFAVRDIYIVGNQ